jgi:hypothetical protein
VKSPTDVELQWTRSDVFPKSAVVYVFFHHVAAAKRRATSSQLTTFHQAAM